MQFSFLSNLGEPMFVRMSANTHNSQVHTKNGVNCDGRERKKHKKQLVFACERK